MSASSRRKPTELQVPRKWKERELETSPERTKVWTEPKNKNSAERKVPVVYYLSRNGHLDHPHFMEVPLSSNDGLYLRDVINRLNVLRGKGMASLYSWSSKRSYKNGFVWHDLSESDFVYPAQGQEYVLKGSEIVGPSPLNPTPLLETASFRALKPPNKAGNDHNFPVITRRRNQSWSSIDLNEYQVYKTESGSESNRRFAADASTQTDERRRRRKPVKEEKEEEVDDEQHRVKSPEVYENQSTELSREEISPPPSDSSPETLESLMKADGRLILCPGGGKEDGLNRAAESCHSGRMKASSVLMQLISCGSISFRECGPTLVKDQGLSLIGQYKARLPCGAGSISNSQVVKEAGTEKEFESFAGVKLEDKDYFSGSLIETKKEPMPTLKRSSSYNADRSSQVQLTEKEIDGVRAKCIPRKPRAVPTKKVGNTNIETCNEGVIAPATQPKEQKTLKS